MLNKHLILAWVKSMPCHGYVMKKVFQDFVNPCEKLNDATLYPLLREMEEEGLIEKEVEEGERGAMRKRVKITRKGAEALDGWLRSSSCETGENRARYDFFMALPFLTKFSFFYELDDATVSEKLEKQRGFHLAKLNDYVSARQKMVDRGLQPCKIQTIDFGIMLEETILRWLDETMDQYTDTGGKAKVKHSARSG